MHVRFLDDCRERPLGLPTRLKERGEVTSVADPRYLQLHRPHPRVPGTLAVAVALPHASGTALVTPSSYVLLDLHLHEGLGEHPNALLEEVRVLLDHRLAQQLREPYPQFIGHRALSFRTDWSLPKEPHGGRPRQQLRLLHTSRDSTCERPAGALTTLMSWVWHSSQGCTKNYRMDAE